MPSWLSERDRLVRLDRIPGPLQSRPTRSMRKLADYRIAARAGVRCPDVLGVWDEPRSIEWDRLRGKVAIKPVRGASAYGVRLLNVSATDVTDLWSGESIDPARLVADLEQEFLRCRTPRALFAETVAVDPAHGGPSDDWKAFMFGREVGMWMQLRRSSAARQAGVRFWSPAWEDVGEVRTATDGVPLDPDLHPPVWAEQLTETAHLLGATWNRPMIRFDLFLDDRGVVFGETTPNPGGFRAYKDTIDRAFGEMADRSAVELGLA